MEISHRRIHLRLKRRYPHIEEELSKPGVLNSVDDIPALYDKFTGLAKSQKSRYDQRLIFISVVMLMDNPDFHIDDDRLPNGLRLAMSRLFNCTKQNITFHCKTVKDYYAVYPKFRDEVQYFYNKMTE